MKKRTLRSNQETDEGKRCAALANSLTKKAPWKGLGAESEEKREPVSDIDTGVVDSLKVLDPDGRLEKPTLLGAVGTVLLAVVVDVARKPPIKHAPTVRRAAKRAGVACRPAQHARASPVR